MVASSLFNSVDCLSGPPCRTTKVKKESHSQEEFLVPDWIEFLRYCLRSFLRLADLNGNVRVTGAGFIFTNQPLSAYHCQKKTTTALLFRNSLGSKD